MEMIDEDRQIYWIRCGECRESLLLRDRDIVIKKDQGMEFKDIGEIYGISGDVAKKLYANQVNGNNFGEVEEKLSKIISMVDMLSKMVRPLLFKSKYLLLKDSAMNVNIVNNLEPYHIDTFADLMGYSEKELLDMDGIGIKSIEQIKGFLKQHDLFLRDDKTCID